MISTNGAGLGHITRLMAIARRLPDGSGAVIATESLAAPLVHDAAFLTEYVPSRRALGTTPARWNSYLRRRLAHLLSIHKPTVVAFDGVVPYAGLVAAAQDHPDLPWVWVRRAMWKRGAGRQWLDRASAFDFVLEPGEFASAADEGLTVLEGMRIHKVDPITLLDWVDLVEPDKAREELGLDDHPTALVQLGAGNINDLQSTTSNVVAELAERGVRVVLARSPISPSVADPPPGATLVSTYPLSPLLRAFDFVVSAAGYNSFHELIAFGIPAVLIPNKATAYDDQVSRARYADKVGAALWLQESDTEAAGLVFDSILDPAVREQLTKRCRELAWPNGAGPAAAWLASVATPAGGR